jgi:hypothetical protein
MRLTLALLAVALAAPVAAEARGNCCFELGVHNRTEYQVDYGDDGLGYDGVYSYAQDWWVRAIVSSRRSRDNPVSVRGSRSLVILDEFTGVTRCKDSTSPCTNREPLPCEGAGEFGKFQVSYYGSGNVSVSSDQLYALPPDDVYYSVDQLGCDGGHGHPGYGEKAEDVASDRSVKLKPPKRDFLWTAGRADRCSYEFSSSLFQGPDHASDGHTTSTSLNASYKLSYFPRSDMRKQRRRLGELAAETVTPAFYDWGEDGTGSQTC